MITIEFNLKQTLFTGDLCIVDGYGNRVWEVIGYTFEKSYYDGEFTEEIIYNLSCTMTSEWTIGVQEETMLVCKAAHANEYISQLGKNGRPPKSTVNIARKEEESMKLDNELLKPHVYPNTKDGLLEELADVLRVVEEIGEIDEEQQLKMEDIKFRLMKYVR